VAEYKYDFENEYSKKLIKDEKSEFNAALDEVKRLNGIQE
jgi:hypothetical protein